MKRWIHKARGIVSLLLVVIFIIETITGIGLYLAPSGRITRETGMMETLHTYAGFAMVAIIIIHLLLNYKMLLNEIKILLSHRK